MSLSVTVIMLTCDRPEMTSRAVRCFEAQTYPHKRLVIYDTSHDAITRYRGHFQHCEIGAEKRTIGALRNLANKFADSDFIAHMDSDDWSHSRRLEEQVALLEATGKLCVGYRELLFWDTRVAHIEVDPTRKGPDGKGCLGTVKSIGEAWIYRNPGRGLCAGGTIMYRRELWEQCPFPDAPHEDIRWWSENQAVSAGYLDASAMPEWDCMEAASMDPRFIARIHGTNTETIPRGTMLSGGGGGVWKRAPEFDSYCAERMKLCA